MSTVKNEALLSRLMTANEDITEVVTIDRLGLDIEVKALLADDVNRIKAQATYPDPKRKGEKIVNEDELNAALLNEAVVGPAELFDKELHKHYEVDNVGDLLEKILLLGEIAQVANTFANINGLSDEDIEQAKN